MPPDPNPSFANPESSDPEPGPPLDPAFGNWLAGFIDGGGSCGIDRRTHRVRPVRYVPTFEMGVRNDDRETLLEIGGGPAWARSTNARSRPPPGSTRTAASCGKAVP
jgi:hypothetical protein